MKVNFATCLDNKQQRLVVLILPEFNLSEFKDVAGIANKPLVIRESFGNQEILFLHHFKGSPFLPIGALDK